MLQKIKNSHLFKQKQKIDILLCKINKINKVCLEKLCFFGCEGGMINVPEMFGCMVFNESEMKKRLSADIYASLKISPKIEHYSC